MNPTQSPRIPNHSANAVRPQPNTCDLLVSVRNLAEAELAVAGGADIIDFKEPLDGALAPVAPEVWQAAARAFPNRTLSAALGESESATRLATHVPDEFRYAKAGPSRTHTTERLGRLWNDLDLPPSVELVPVAYVDHHAADCPHVDEILQLVTSQGRHRMLVDTFVKDGSRLTDHLGMDELAALVTHARNANVWIALAGSLRSDDATEMLARGISPDCWGVRGDVCVETSSGNMRDRRAGTLDPRQIGRWKQVCRSPTRSVEPEHALGHDQEPPRDQASSSGSPS